MLWALLFGPLGVALFAFGEWKRHGKEELPTTSTVAEDLNVPVQVNIGGGWLEGRLQTWAQGEDSWHGWVRYSVDGEDRADWFKSEDLRRHEVPS